MADTLLADTSGSGMAHLDRIGAIPAQEFVSKMWFTGLGDSNIGSLKPDHRVAYSLAQPTALIGAFVLLIIFLIIMLSVDRLHKLRTGESLWYGNVPFQIVMWLAPVAIFAAGWLRQRSCNSDKDGHFEHLVQAQNQMEEAKVFARAR
jgi:hypothetical protein